MVSNHTIDGIHLKNWTPFTVLMISSSQNWPTYQFTDEITLYTDEFSKKTENPSHQYST